MKITVTAALVAHLLGIISAYPLPLLGQALTIPEDSSNVQHYRRLDEVSDDNVGDRSLSRVQDDGNGDTYDNGDDDDSCDSADSDSDDSDDHDGDSDCDSDDDLEECDEDDGEGENDGAEGYTPTQATASSDPSAVESTTQAITMPVTISAT